MQRGRNINQRRAARFIVRSTTFAWTCEEIMRRFLLFVGVLGILTPPYTTELAILLDLICIAGFALAIRWRRAS
jgi:hypothetical protein